MENKINALLINANDDVAVVTEIVQPGDLVCYGQEEGACVTAVETIPVYHKIAVREIAAGKRVLKYGYPIGEATEEIRAGAHVHCHNMVSPDGKERM